MSVHRRADLIGSNSVVVVLPCHNAGLTIASVVLGFQKSLPGADIVVFDNGSDDNTAHMARAAGARVFQKPHQSMADLIRLIFAELDADLYLLAGGDGTDDPARAPDLIDRLVDQGADMVVGVQPVRAAYATKAFNRLSQFMLGPEHSDILSGYRAFTRRFAKSFSGEAVKTDVATEMSLLAHHLRLPVAEVEVEAGHRQDGWSRVRHSSGTQLRMLASLVRQCRETRPTTLIAAGFLALALPGGALATNVLFAGMEPGSVTGLAQTIIALGLLSGALAIVRRGIRRSGAKRRRIERKRLSFLASPGLSIDNLTDDGDPARAEGAEARRPSRQDPTRGRAMGTEIKAA